MTTPVEKLDAFAAATKPAAPRPVVARAPAAGLRPETKARARRYVAKVPGGVQGDRGSNPAFKVACYLYQDFGLPEADSFELLAEWNATCDPPFSEKELRHKVAQAIKHGKPRQGNERGWLAGRSENPNVHVNGHAGRSAQPAVTPVGPDGDGFPDAYLPDGVEFDTSFDVAALEAEAAAEADDRWRCRPVSSATFATSDYRLRFVVQRCLVEGQPAVVGGPQKVLKTNIGVDLCVSIASGTPFLGAFEVRTPRRVLFLSGESGAFTLKETALRVCKAKGVDLAGLPVYWEFSLPQLGRPDDVAELERALAEHGADVLFLDPLYLTLLAGAEGGIDEKSIFAMGMHLRAVALVCQRTGVTPVLAHHSNRRVEPGKPMELQHLAYAGIAEFARQWLLISRAVPYGYDGNHELLLSVGGSAGHGGLFYLRVSEGVTDDSFSGRTWETKLTPMGDARQEMAAQREAEKAERERKTKLVEETAVLDAVAKVCLNSPAATKNEIRDLCGFNAEKAGRVLARLLGSGEVQRHEFKKKCGKTDRVIEGFRRPPQDVGPVTLFGLDADDADDADKPVPPSGSSGRPGSDADDADDADGPPLGAVRSPSVRIVPDDDRAQEPEKERKTRPGRTRKRKKGKGKA